MVIADHLSDARFYGLVLIGVDELACRRGQRNLTRVADPERGRIVWAKPGRDAARCRTSSSGIWQVTAGHQLHVMCETELSVGDG